jgi:hypothetical protein
MTKSEIEIYSAAWREFALAKPQRKMENKKPLCAVSSVVEHHIDTVGVTGSNPVSRTIFS